MALFKQLGSFYLSLQREVSYLRVLSGKYEFGYKLHPDNILATRFYHMKAHPLAYTAMIDKYLTDSFIHSLSAVQPQTVGTNETCCIGFSSLSVTS